MLGFEIIVVFLAALVIWGLAPTENGSLGLPPWVALAAGGVLILGLIATIGLLRYPWGFTLGWVLQVLILAAGFLNPAMFFVGVLFGGLWWYCMVVGARIDRDRTAQRRSGTGTGMTTGIEETLVLVKPDGVARNLTGEILRRIEAKGYSLVDIRMVQPDREILAKHYAEHEGKPFYEPLVEFMQSGPVVAMRVAGNRVIEGFRVLAGTTDPTTAAPGTIRGDFGRDWGLKVQQNLVHGSDSRRVGRARARALVRLIGCRGGRAVDAARPAPWPRRRRSGQRKRFCRSIMTRGIAFICACASRMTIA